MNTTHAITLSIGGLALRFLLRNAALAAKIVHRYNGWTSTRVSPHITFTCVCSGPVAKGMGRSSMPRIVGLSGDSGHILRSDFECWWEGMRGSITLRASIYTFDALVRVLFGTLLPRQHRLILHASAIATERTTGFVFPGRSGSGKTTIARLLQHRTVLCDELCVVSGGSARSVTVSGTPFWGEMRTGPAHPEPYPLRALLFLVKAPCTGLLPLDRGDALRRLLHTVCSFSRDAATHDHLFSLAQGIVERTPSFELCFRRDATEVAAVLDTLRRRHARRP